MEHEYNILDGYVPSFVQHLKDTRARLGLARGDSVDDEDPENAAGPHASPHWTPAERDAFFRAVSVHSRWRPDLIAACVPTKTEWEAWMYLEALEEGAAMLATQQDDNTVMQTETETEDDQDVEMHDDGSHSNSDSNVDEDEEEMCKPAFEVSQDWIDVEERMAAWIVENEQLVPFDGGDTVHTTTAGERPPKRKRGRPRKATVSLSPPAHRSTSPVPGSGDPIISRDRERETLMGRLEVPHLQVLDSILREGEEVTEERSKSREGSITMAALTEHGDNEVPHADVSSLSDRIAGPSGTSNASSDAVIDPVLLVLSGPTNPTSTERQCIPPRGSSSLNSPSRESREDSTPASPDAEPMSSLFSPRSRRRIQKRLYMRRKRALLRGESVGPDSSLDAGIERLRPGKKAKSVRSDASVSMPCSEAPSDAEGEMSRNVSKKNKAGLTLPYKLRAKFAELGVDVAYLRDQGMDLLNLGALGRLMGLYTSLELDEEEEEGIAESIDAQLIRCLQAATVSFVTDVMHRAIVWREREIRLKQRSRVWRHGDQFTISAVEHAVAAIGVRYESHKAYFKSLEGFYGLSNEASGNAAERVDPDVGTAHRDVYTPLVCSPSASLACVSRMYALEATRTRRGTSIEMSEDELTSDEETDEETARDARDERLSALHEDMLWTCI